MLEKDIKIFGIRKGYIQIALILIVLIIAFSLIVAKASAANQSYYIPPTPTVTPNITQVPLTAVTTPPGVNTPLPTPVPTPTDLKVRRLAVQGGCVDLGETIDISGIGWYTGYIAYYGKYRTMSTEGMNASKIYEIPSWEIRHYYIDPLLYKNFPGNWYSHYETVETGNSMLFKIPETNCSALIKQVNGTANATNITSIVVENKTPLLVRNLTLTPKTIPNIDYIVSRNANTTLNISGALNARYWIFGKQQDDTLYDIPLVNGSITFNKSFSNKLSKGIYHIIVIKSDGNSIAEERYDENTSSISSPFRDVPPVFIGSATSEVAMNLLKERIKASLDDTYTQFNITVEDPSVDVRRLDMSSNINGTNSILISGYTNANVGDTITIEFDKGHIDEKLIRKNTWVAVVQDGGKSNAYRTWYKSALFEPNDFPAGEHTLTMTSSTDAFINAPVFIRKELPENYKPPEYVQFIDNNPFVPTPTPIVLPREVVTVVQTIVKTEVVEKEKIVTVDPYPYVIGTILAMIVIFYALYTVARAYMNARRIRNEKKEEESYYESENLEGN